MNKFGVNDTGNETFRITGFKALPQFILKIYVVFSIAANIEAKIKTVKIFVSYFVDIYIVEI